MIAREISPVESERNRLAAQRFGQGARLLCVDMQVRLAAVAAVADFADHVSALDRVTDADADAAAAEVAHEQPDAVAVEDHVVAGHLRAIHLRDRLIRYPVDGGDHRAIARGVHGVAEDRIAPGIARQHAAGTQTSAPELDDVHPMALPPPGTESRLAPERPHMCAHEGVPAPVHDEIGALPEREGRLRPGIRPAAPVDRIGNERPGPGEEYDEERSADAS